MAKHAPNQPNGMLKQQQKTMWLKFGKLSLVAVGLMFIPRSSSRKADYDKKTATR